MMIVTAGIIEREGKILIAQRPANAHRALEWEFPGGKLEPGEQPEECLKRELREELGLNVEVEDIYKVVLHRYEDREVLLLCYRCQYAGGEPEAKEGQDFRWVTVEQMGAYDFSAADIPVLEKLHRERT
ncbi:NUDIX hydrolase [Clostridiales bacterium PH28_bin88]|nr:NUDIX hydrolase [Clostridiales bacterium PH28_bin88]